MKNNLKEVFGQVIKQLREQNGLSQQELADYAEIDRTHVSDLERGIYHPSLNTVYKLAEILKIKPSELIAKVDSILKI
ncbi:MAG: helix-turn-helix transcriptional regulator [Cyclobacteriaceae bacterium]|nr:helix-turn-helix transcriptional regulator [Cyclobacteriaceae bacterium]